MDEPPSAKRRRVTVQVQQKASSRRSGSPRVKEEGHVQGAENRAAPSAPAPPPSTNPHHSEQVHGASAAPTPQQTTLSSGISAEASPHPGDDSTPQLSSGLTGTSAPTAPMITNSNTPLRANWVTGQCNKCSTKLGSFRNEWIRVGVVFGHPVESDPGNIDLVRWNLKKKENRGGPFDGWSLKLFQCSNCLEQAGMQCLDAPAGRDRYKGWIFYTLSNLKLVSETGGDPVTPVIKDSMGQSRTTALNNTPKETDSRDATPRSATPIVTTAVPASPRRVHPQTRNLRRKSRGATSREPMTETSPLINLESLKFPSLDKTMEMLTEHATKVEAHAADLDQLRQTAVYIVDVLDGEKQNREHISSVLDDQGRDIEYINDKVERLEQDMTEIKNWMQEMRQEMKELRSRPTPAPAPQQQQQQRDEHSVTFAMEEMELLTNSITTIGNKANEVDSLKMQLAIMKRRIQTLEEATSNQRSSHPPPMQNQNVEHNTSRPTVETVTQPTRQYSPVQESNVERAVPRPRVNHERMNHERMNHDEGAPASRQSRQYSPIEGRNPQRGIPKARQNNEKNKSDLPAAKPSQGIFKPAFPQVNASARPPRHSSGNLDNDQRGNRNPSRIPTQQYSDNVDYGTEDDYEEDPDDQTFDILAVDQDDPDDMDYRPSARSRARPNGGTASSRQSRPNWQQVNPNSLWHPESYEFDYATPDRDESQAPVSNAGRQKKPKKGQRRDKDGNLLNPDGTINELSRRLKLNNPNLRFVMYRQKRGLVEGGQELNFERQTRSTRERSINSAHSNGSGADTQSAVNSAEQGFVAAQPLRPEDPREEIRRRDQMAKEALDREMAGIT